MESLYVGGGTPTAMGEEILDKALSIFSPYVTGHTEFTVEANPGTLTEAIADALAARGVNRVSLGAQSFDPEVLKTLGRIHGADEISQSVLMLRRAGITNINLDLIFAVPGQTLESWRRTLLTAIDHSPKHVSCYALSLEDATPLARSVEDGKLSEQDQDAHRLMYDLAVGTLSAGGLDRYEISNFCRLGQECRHNLTYWRNEPYLGIGAGAVSFDGAVRKKNLPDLDVYIAAIGDGKDSPGDGECMEGKLAMAETVMLGLRLERGIDRQAFVQRYGRDILDAFPLTTKKFSAAGRIVVDPDSVRLSREMFFVSNLILSDFFEEAEINS